MRLMRIALSTNWNTNRHETGEAMVDEILALGFDALELGYHTTEEIAAGVLRRVESGAVTVDSVHAYCPVPIGAPHGYPELYLLASLDEDERAMAAILLTRTLDFACGMGAKAVVLHAGRVFLKTLFREISTGTLAAALMEDEAGTDSGKYRQTLDKAMRLRAKRVRKYFDGFCLSLDTLLPKFEKAGVTLCLENLPSIEAFPDEREMIMLKQRFNTPALAYWHDFGHGQVREYMGWIRHVEAARSLLPFARGAHIHDALPLMDDHLPPGQGQIDFAALGFFAAENIIKVFEPSSEVGGEALAEALRYIKEVWGLPKASPGSLLVD